MPLSRKIDPPTQRLSLTALIGLVKQSMLHPRVRTAAIRIISDCSTERDPDADFEELQAIFRAVKDGDDRVEGLDKGLRYVPDPRGEDYFIAPHRMLEMCEDGACGEDCDSHSMLIAALCGAIGFHVGLRAWGNLKKKGFQHVYAVVHFPKREPFTEEISLDTTVKEATVGWKPPTGRTETQWIPE